jgi:hypothetical protein
MLTIRDWSSRTSLGRAGTGTFRYKVRISNALVTKLTQPKINIAKMSLDISSSSSGDGELRSAHEGTAGYKLRTRSRETRIRMAKMARAMCEEDDDELSESKTRITIKRPRSYVRASVIGNFRFATATKSSTTTRFFPLNICYYRLCIVLSFAYHIFIATVTPNHVLL